VFKRNGWLHESHRWRDPAFWTAPRHWSRRWKVFRGSGN